jgi:hypothetical protein
VLLHDRPPICAPVGGDLRAVVYGAAAAGVVIPSVARHRAAAAALPTRPAVPGLIAAPLLGWTCPEACSPGRLSIRLPVRYKAQDWPTAGPVPTLVPGEDVGTRVEFAILGPLEVRLDGASAQIGGPKHRALLAMLLCNATGWSRDRLIEELNADPCREPATADRLLRVPISRLGKALAVNDDEPRLVACPGGYLRRIEDGELDLDAFGVLVSTSRSRTAQPRSPRTAIIGCAASICRPRRSPSQSSASPGSCASRSPTETRPAQVRYTSRFRGIAGTVRKGVCLALLNSLAVLR